MSLRDPNRAAEAFQVDDVVRRALAAWGQERDSEIGRLNLGRAAAKMTPEQKAQLVARLAEISLGLLFTLLEGAGPPAPRGRGKKG
ncbi:MAG: hypothetical protein IT384_32860 [Deltaproteobacteria bacterium]|nr:hypothetical protein [Deltaproteobacteria bacterium]